MIKNWWNKRKHARLTKELAYAKYAWKSRMMEGASIQQRLEITPVEYKIACMRLEDELAQSNNIELYWQRQFFKIRKQLEGMERVQ